MDNNYLITGYWGEPHVTAENDRGINAGTFGAGRFVLPVGERLRAEYIGNNTIRLYDGKLMDNGAAAGIPAGEFVDLLIENTSQGMKRTDLIVFQYEKDSATLVESGKFVVVQGTEASGTAPEPMLTREDLLSGKASFDQMPLWHVSVSGSTISAPVQLFTVSETMASMVDKIYPVGSIYMSVNGTNPKYRFGGSWEQIKGRFLLGCGSNNVNTDNTFGTLSVGDVNRPAGERGGEVYHTLTTAEMPNHAHGLEGTMLIKTNNAAAIQQNPVADGSPNSNNYVVAQAEGGNQPHNNMPPYLAVYIWKRTA